ncbi:hypothetical protein DL766_001643 [Monosporascus sp. MC13-8B]|nr:hypothetical protein DL763_008679 [Monosporascus cannonballus]RYP37174.1 hypothetical protein DL766_001643 [Monosporascus sp. MC13-8B]
MSSCCYSPLAEGSIRLLRLMPHRDEHSPIQCQLFDCPLLDSENAVCIDQGNPNEKGLQVQSMAKIYAKASRVIVWLGETAADSDQALEEIRIAAVEQSTKSLINRANPLHTPSGPGPYPGATFGEEPPQKAILTLLQRPWFQRIWVLQEAAAARHVLIKCGHTEIDGYAFCSGLSALKLSYETCPDLQVLIRSVIYLIKGAVFRPRRATSQPGRFSLNICPLSELVDMYHTRKATERRDKVYALLGMSSDPNVAGLSADYDISWRQLFQRLVNFLISEEVFVDTWDDKEMAIIKGKGCVLGEVSSVERDIAWEDRQNVDVTWNAPRYFGMREKQTSRWTFQASAKSIQVGDAVCLLQGASRPTIIRPYNSYWVVIMIAVPPTDDPQATGHGRWIQGDGGELEPMVDELIKDNGVWTPLRLAAANGHEAVVNLLLGAGEVDPNAEDKYGWTPVLLAAANGQEAVVKLLFDTGKVDLNARDKYGWTPMLWAAASGHKAVVKLLLDTGKVDPDVKDKSEITPLWWAARNGHEAVVKLLLDTGKVDPDARDKDNRTPLSLAAESGHGPVVKLLLGTGKANPNRKFWNEWPPLSWAAENGHEAIVRLLLGTGKVNPDSKDNNGWTPLRWAAKYGSEAVVKLLLGTGKVDVNVKDIYGQTPLWGAAENGHEAVVKLLLDTGKVDLNPKDIYRQTPLWYAARNGHEAVAKLLLDTGKVDLDTKNEYGWTPLGQAVMKKHEAVVKLLLGTGKVDLNVKDIYRQTPLWYAAGNGHEGIVKLLLDTGKVDPDVKDENGLTPLNWAAKKGHKAVVKMLLDTGKVGPDAKDKEG